ncbi:MAG: HAD family hydrolase [Comamonas sp. SCN 67-35]|uniref:HAD family hydrolase n=1 Tax=unclassified Comamonas TaxID=2638500 RepID=UPI000869C10F|nr:MULTISPECIES: HAD family phosphatase [unclassified Comamonas]MBN9331376.1 HAD family phosphatase [Comamonas sp.]ODU37380.1 MAG: HAD family hydrolase [Comamonas sp. SCN 67-35]OJX02216.1 MAG: HAD family hydrolase [Burkholderiales bacterium 66-26]
MTETFDAVLFDCDGVLVDSEAITNGVLCEMLNESGWALSPAQCLRIFIGKAVRSEARRIEQETGRPLTDEWMTAFYARRNARLAAELQPISGAVDTVRAIHALLGGRIACASGADRAKVEMQLAQVGMKPYFGPHVFSGHDLPRSKPAPDVYLAAAASLGVAPGRCLVVEDTTVGVRAGVDAGATVVGYCPGEGAVNTARQLREAGVVHILSHMSQLPGWLAGRRAAPFTAG